MGGAAWAARFLGYDFAALPWQAEVLDALIDPATAEVPLLGPSQIGKTEIGLAWMGHCIERDPGPMLICQQDKSLAEDFVQRRIDPFIRRHRTIKECFLPAANADKVHIKQFRGMMLSMAWPVPAHFTARPIRYGWLDDYDQFPDDIGGTASEGGQGDAISLLDGRSPSFEGRDTKFVSSSPARDDLSGTEEFIAGSTDERLWPRCPSCGERFEIDTLRDLKFEGDTADEAAASAYVLCPVSGCVLPPDEKYSLLRSLADLPNSGFIAANVTAGKRRRGFRVDGLLGLRSWSEMARKWFEAKSAWAARQDESKLRTFVQTVAGKNYRSILSGEKPLQPADLSGLKVAGWRLGTVPHGPIVITLAVDVQHDRFEIIAKGWADGMESWTIDRFSIDVLEDGLTVLEPFRKPEHWRVLLALFDRTWPLAGVAGARSPVPLCIAIDTGGGGEKNVATATDNAKKFWHLAVAAGVHRSRIMLLKGSSRRDVPMVGAARRADQKSKGGVKRNSPPLWLVNVHQAHHVLDARLRRRDAGPGRVYYPEDFEDRWFEELTAEELKAGKWEKIRARNETRDLENYAWFALLKPPFAQSRDHFRWVAKDFRIVWPAPLQNGPVDTPVGELTTAGGRVETPNPAAPSPLAPARRAAKAPARSPRGRGNGWMGRLKR